MRQYEHESYAKGSNMETVYQKKHDMGGWSRGTPVTIVKKMEKMVMDVRRHANPASEEGAGMGRGHAPPRRRGKGKGKGKGKELEDDYEEEDEEEEGEEEGEEEEEGGEGEEVAPMNLPPASIRRQRRLSIIVDTPEQSSTTVSPSPPARNQDSPDSPPPIKKARLVSVVPPPRMPTSREAEKRPTTILHYFSKRPVAEMSRDEGLAGPRPKNSPTHDNPTTDNDTDDPRTKRRVWVPRVKSPATEHKHRRKASSLSRSRASTVSSDELLSAHAPTPLTSVAAIRAPSKGLASHRPKSTTTSKLVVKKPRKMKRLSQPGTSAPAPVIAADEWEVERIVRHRFQDSQKEYLVKWLGFPDSDNS